MADGDLDAGVLAIDMYDHDKASKHDEEIGSAALPLSTFKDTHHWQGWLPIRSKLYFSQSRSRGLTNDDPPPNTTNGQEIESKEADTTKGVISQKKPDSPITIAKSGTSETEEADDLSLNPRQVSPEFPDKQVQIQLIHSQKQSIYKWKLHQINNDL